MCGTCGCESGPARLEEGSRDHQHPRGGRAAQTHAHAPEHVHEHAHEEAGTAAARLIRIEQDILAKNEGYAAQNRGALAERAVFALNLVSSPGAGKTALLIKTIQALGDEFGISVIEGDQQTSRDADRIRATGARAVQINTGKACHLDAHMVGHALARLDPPRGSVLMIENVGNLVCPAAFDLGEAHKVVVLSVTEGEDKPLKYPDMFRRASLMLLNKIDLLPYLEFDLGRCMAYAHRTNPDLTIIGVSAVTGEGMSEWLSWLAQGAAGAGAVRGKPASRPDRAPAQAERAPERGQAG